MRADRSTTVAAATLLAASLACLLVSDAAAGVLKRTGKQFHVGYGYETYAGGAAADDKGRFVVVWQNDSTDGIFGRRFARSGAPLGAEFQINTSTQYSVRYPDVAAAGSGEFVVVWLDSGLGVRGQRFDSSGAQVGSEFQVNESTPSFFDATAVSADRNGDFVVTWLGSNSFIGEVFAKRFKASGAPLGAEFLISPTADLGSGELDVASDPHGDFVVVWTDAGSVRGQRFAKDGSALGGEFAVTSGNYDGRPRVARAGNGDFVVGWTNQEDDGGYSKDGDSDGVFARRFTSGGQAAGPEQQINAYTVGPQTLNSVTTDEAGNFAMLWTTYGAFTGSDVVIGRFFDNQGNPLTGDFQVNSYVSGDQSDPVVTPTRRGQFVVAWNDFGQNSIEAQRFRMPTCAGEAVTIWGTNGDDVIDGTPGADVIHGLGGNDVIRGGFGTDTICGGDGNDALYGEEGHDRLEGGAGDDTLVGGVGIDSCSGGGGTDVVSECE